MLRTIVVFALAVSFIVPTGSALAQEETTVSFVGAGWGHGVGLSQYGAYGASRDGWLVDEILGHFYKGTFIETMGVGDLAASDDIWVSLRQDQESITLIAEKINYTESLGSTADVTVARGAESWVMAIDEELRVDRIDGTRNCELTFIDPVGVPIRSRAGTCDIDITWDGDAEEPTRKIAVEGCEFADWNGPEPGIEDAPDYRECEYGRGHMVIRAPGDNSIGPFDVTMVLDLEDYVLGISEMPYYWGLDENGGMEALKAQAIAARSYARQLMLAQGSPGSNDCGGWCHVKDDPSYQRYVGWGHGWSVWTAAVQNTAHQVVVHDDAPYGVVPTYYSSSTGGATENVHEVWGGTVSPEYLTSRPDQWSLTSINPNDSWTNTFTVETVAYRLWFDSSKPSRVLVLDTAEVVERNTSGSAGTVVFTGTIDGDPESTTMSGRAVDQNFGLKSIYFDVVFGDIGDLPPFNDIGGSVHYGDIVYIEDLGITQGCNPPANTNYCPAGLVTRGEMAAFMVRSLGLSDDGGKDWFGDDNGSIFENDINKLAAAGITRGCNAAGTDFCPDASVTRGEMAAFMVRGFGYTDPGTGDWFIDDDGSLFEGDIDRLKAAGVTVGCNPPDNTNYCPDDSVQRGEMASFLARALRGLT